MSNAQTPPVYQLRVTLDGIEPPIWRRIEVPADSSLEALDAVIETAMGWTAGHLHGFTVLTGMSTRRGRPIEEMDEPYVALRDVLKKKGDVIDYVYDFGDHWQHEVLLEDILETATAGRLPRCTMGARACPPEDIGGIYGYFEILESIATSNVAAEPEGREDAGSGESKDAVAVEWENGDEGEWEDDDKEEWEDDDEEWAEDDEEEWGEDDEYGWASFDPEAFDVENVNRRLAQFPTRAMRACKRPPTRRNGSSSSVSGRRTASLPHPSAREMERTARSLQRMIGDRELDSSEDAKTYLKSLIASGESIPDFEPGDDPLLQAQDLADRAVDAPSKEEAVRLAHEALNTSTDCADAYVVLAESDADSPEEALALFAQGVEAGEHALGPQAFEEWEGRFWGRVETRPYMRARIGLAQTLWQLGDREAAVDHLRDMLRLNEDDHQGVRFLLSRYLLDLDADEALEELLQDYAEDDSTAWLFTWALTLFRLDGNSVAANEVLDDALDENPHVAVLLLNLKKPPPGIPSQISGDAAAEAIAYATVNADYWRTSHGALRWLRKRISEWSRGRLNPVGHQR